MSDTYLDTRGVHKGEVWLNKQPLGRFWSIGPQYTLFTPGPGSIKGATISSSSICLARPRMFSRA